MKKPLPWTIGCPFLSDMTIETTEPFASRDIAGISKWPPLFVLGTFCADIAATSNRTAAMYCMNEIPSDRDRPQAVGAGSQSLPDSTDSQVLLFPGKRPFYGHFAHPTPVPTYPIPATN